jgi:hypothetical protein
MKKWIALAAFLPQDAYEEGHPELRAGLRG